MTLLAIFSAGIAVEAKPGKKFDPERQLTKMQKKLKLSDAQVSKIREIGKKYGPVRKAAHEKVRALKNELHQLLASDNPDRATVKNKLENISKLKIEARLSGFDQRQEVVKVLTIEQRNQWQQRMKKRRSKKSQE